MHTFRSSKYKSGLYAAMALLLLLALPLPALAQAMAPRIDDLQEQPPIVEDDPLIGQTESFDHREHTFSPYGDSDPQYGYVFNPDDDEINIINLETHADTGTSIDTSPYGTYPWRGALSPDGQWLYVSLYESERVAVFATDTNSHTVTIDVGDGPNGIVFTPDSAYAFVANVNGGTVSVIDAGAQVVTATIPVGYGPSSVAIAPQGEKVYVTNYWDNSVSVLDTGALTVTATLTGLSGPWDVVISPSGDRAYVSNGDWGDGSISVIDTANGVVTDT
jgi:YVTN family beta-propeller protein